jgi:hypothetical protein
MTRRQGKMLRGVEAMVSSEGVAELADATTEPLKLKLKISL